MKLFKQLKNGQKNLILVFPHAGSGPLQYKELAKKIPNDWGVQVVLLPGREEKLSQPSVSHWLDLKNQLIAEVPDLIVGFERVILFGHSMGAWLAFEVINELCEELNKKKALFVASSMKPPTEKSLLSELASKLSDEEFLEKISEIKGIPEELKKNKEFLQTYLNAIRADLKLMLDASVYKDKKVDMDVLTILGNADPVVNFKSICEWKEMFTGNFKLVCLAGGHFTALEKVGSWFSVAEDLLKDTA